MKPADASAAAMPASPRWRPADGVIWQEAADCAVFVLNTVPLDPRPLRLDGGGAVIWQAVTGGEPLDTAELVTVVAEMTGEDPEMLAPTIGSFLDELRAAELLDVAPLPDGPSDS